MSKLYNVYVRSYRLDPETDSAFFDVVGDLYYTDEVQGQKQYRQHSSINRLDHVRSVTYLTYRVSKKLRFDVRAATRGAMLHDLTYYDWHDPARWHRPHGFKHPRFAMLNAEKLNPAITEREKNIILRHMWPLTPIPPRYKEGWVVTLADKYCATQEMLRDHSDRLMKKFTTALCATE